MGVIMFLRIWIILSGVVKYVHSDSSRLCFTYEMGIGVLCRNMSVEISCMKNELIMIKDIQFARKLGSPSCNLCTSDGESFPWHTNSVISLVKSWLYYSCSKKNSCDFESVLATPTLDYKPFILAANITYRCVKEDLFKDICSSWIQETDYVHMSLMETRSIPSYCTCIIVGDSLDTKLQVTDYRPYKDLFECADSSLFIDGKEMFQCIENGQDFSVYNKNIEVVNSEINITVTFAASLPEMLWIHMEGSDDTNIFSIPVIAGSSVGFVALVILISVIVCIVCTKRKSNRMTKCKQAESTDLSSVANIPTIRNSVLNKSYEYENEMVNFSTKKPSNYEEINQNKEDDSIESTEYAETDDVVAENIYVEASIPEKIFQRFESSSNKNEDNNFMIPHDNDSHIYYTKVMKNMRKANAYDTCSVTDNYSHIQTVIPKQARESVDNYSHIPIAGNKPEVSCSDNYSHTTLRQ